MLFARLRPAGLKSTVHFVFPVSSSIEYTFPLWSPAMTYEHPVHGVEGVQVPVCSPPTMLENVAGEFWLLYSVRIHASVRTTLPTRTSSSWPSKFVNLNTLSPALPNEKLPAAATGGPCGVAASSAPSR